MTITRKASLLLGAAGVLAAASPALAQQGEADMKHQVNAEEARSLLQDWAEPARNAGEAMIEAYGAPDEVTQTRMIWTDAGPWKWSILTNDPTEHNFPAPHEDVLEQAIAYEVPLDMVDELARYDGSVVYNRTEGELSARCDLEGANYLAINLAHDVSTGAKSVEEARSYYGSAISTFKSSGELDPYMEGFAFELPSGDQADPDERVIPAAG